MFNKPMVPIQEVSSEVDSGPLLFEPQIKGKYKWLGTATLTFWPTDTLPFASEYNARIPAGTKALDGSVLPSDYNWKFETPRPQLVRTYPGDQSRNVTLDADVFLQFNQAIDPVAAKSFIFLDVVNTTGETAVPFQLRYPTKQELDKFGWDNLRDNILILVPDSNLATGTRYVTHVKEGMPGMIGSLGTPSNYEVYFYTYYDFRFVRLEDTTIMPDDQIEIEFSNPVQMKDLVDHISFEPAIKIPSDYSEEYYGSRTILSLYLSFLPDTTYKLKIDGQLKDIFGNKLGNDAEASFSTGSYKPHYYMAGGEGTVEAYGKRLYPIAALNVDSMRLQMGEVPMDKVVPFMVDKSYTPVITVDKEIATGAKRNKLMHVMIAVNEPLRGKNFGFVYAEVSDPVPELTEEGPTTAFLQVTSLGITGKFSPETNLVWVTHLKDCDPVKDAEVQVRDDQNNLLWSGKTDKDGLVRTPGWGALGVKPREWQQPRLWIFAREGDDWAFTRNEEGTGIDPWRFGVDYEWRPQFQETRGTIFTDRGLYRAGEEVQIKGIIRQRVADAWAIRPGTSAVVTVTDGMNENVLTDTLRLSEFGSFAIKFQMDPSAHLGEYNVRAYVKKTGLEYAQYDYFYDEDRQSQSSDMISVAEGSFRVEAFRPAESEVTVKFLQDSYIMGDTVNGSVTARYLFGAPMRNDKVSLNLHAFPGYYNPPGYDDYSFGPSWWDKERTENLLTSIDTVLSEEGTLSLNYPIAAKRLHGTQDLLLEATATSPSRRSVTGRASAVLHAGQFYIGIKESNFFMSLRDTLGYDLIAVRPDGTPAAGSRMKVSVIKRQWVSVRRAETNGRYYWQTDKIDSTLTQYEAISTAGPIHEQYVPEHAGYYLISVTSTDNLGNDIESGNDFYVTGSSYVAWERSDDDRIELVADRKSYKPGDVAHVMVKSPYESSRSLVTIERDGILQQWTTELNGSAPEISIPITEKHLPNIFVSVVLLQGRVTAEDVTGRGEDVGRPSFKIGYVDLPVDAGTQHLDVTVSTDKENYHPGDSVEVTVGVKNLKGAGTPSEVVVSVADMGVLNLINYELPDPFDTFFGPRALGVMTSETIVHLVQQRTYGEKGEDQGGGGMSLAEIQMRGDFRFTAYWNPSIITDDSGGAKFKFKLPDNLSQFKVMAVAETRKSEFGSGNTTFRVNKEFMLQGALPRFARSGDEFSAGVVATNYSKQKGSVTLLASVDKNVALLGKDTVNFELAPGESKEVRFDYTASSQVGKATINYQAYMGKFTDGLTMTIPVEVPRVMQSDALYESTADSAKEAIIVPSDVYAGMGDVQFSAASSALGGLESSVDYLFTYPYGCLEQRLSCILPIIDGEKMVKAFNLPVFNGEDLRKVVQSVLDQVYEFQTESGGFAYWKGDHFAYPYLSGYALMVLGRARERGYSIDDDVLNDAIKYCEGFLREDVKQEYYPGDEECQLATKALMVYALSTVGHNEVAYMEQLAGIRYKLPVFAEAFLVEALHRASTGNGALRVLESGIVRDLMNTAKFSSTTAHFEEPDWEGLKWVFSSNTRTTAIVLQALLETGNRDPFLSKVAKWIMTDQKVGRWRTTQENVCVVAALSDYFEAFESQTPLFTAQISVSGQKVLNAIFNGRSFNTVTESKSLESFERKKQLPVSITKTGAGRLYYGIRMNYYPTSDTVARDEGIAVLKTITTVDDKPVPKNADGNYVLKAGYMYKVNLTVISPQEREFVVVDDPVPAGTETVDLTFATESDYLGASVENEEEEADVYWSGGFNHIEQKDDRVLLFATTLPEGIHHHSYLVRAATYGSFALPATHAEEMYSPDVFGQTGQGSVIVK